MIVSVLEPYSLFSMARLQSAGAFTVSDKVSTATEVLLIRSHTVVDKAFLDKAPALKLVVTATSGFNHIDWRECAKRGVVAAHTPDANAGSTAELTFGLMIAWERQLLALHRNVKTGRWKDDLKRPHGLEGRTLGVVGLGRVGARVANMGLAFGMRVQAHDPYVPENHFREVGAERLGFIELLRTSDYVSLHVPLTRETRHLLNQPTFNEMQNDAVLVNTCRGPVVDENDLMMALDSGVIAGAAMDVIEREPPPPGHRVLNHPKLLLSPHVGAFTTTAFDKASAEAVEKVLAFKAGLPVGDTLPLRVPWFEHT